MAIKQFFKDCNEIVGEIPSTNFRILMSIVWTTAIVVRYLITGTAPSFELISMMLIAMGLDVAQFRAKRNTTWNITEARNINESKTLNETRTTDLSEQQRKDEIG